MYNRLAGRFTLVDRIDKSTIVVGCIGSLKAETIDDREKEYIAAFYIDGFPTRVHVIASEVLSEYETKNRNNYNDFIKLTVERRKGW